MAVDALPEKSTGQAADFVERRSERRLSIDNRVKAYADWIMTLDEKVNSGILDPLDRAYLVSRPIVARDLLIERAIDRRDKAQSETDMAREQTLQALELAKKDPKTGVLNSREFEKDYQALMESGATFGVLMIDLDYFKRINDIHGHPVGDRVLIQTALNIGICVRQSREREEENDRVYRYGGEEFVVLLPGMQEEGTLKNVAETIRISIGETSYIIAERKKPVRHIPVTVSIGGGIYRPGSGADFFQQVDGAMYGAKSEGRDRTNILPRIING